MNKAELVSAMAEKTALSKKDAEAALKAFTDIVAEELKKGEKIQLVGFGTFEVSERAERTGTSYRRSVLYIYTVGADSCGRRSGGRVMWNRG